jgi:rare lipoprotein A
VCVRSLVNGREVLVRINDRGPYTSGRIIDLSRAAAESIGLLDLGIKQVALSVVNRDTAACGGSVVGALDAPPSTAEDPAPKPAPRVARRKR